MNAAFFALCELSRARLLDRTFRDFGSSLALKARLKTGGNKGKHAMVMPSKGSRSVTIFSLAR